MSAFYTDGQRAMQEQFETTRMADLLHQVIVHAEVQEAEREFIESRDMFFLATVDPGGRPTCSYKGGDPGFVKVIDPRTLVFPIYDGNGMYLSLGNLATTAQVGMLFIDFETPHRLRVQGTASIDRQDPLRDRYPGADVLVRVAVSGIFVNCSRYVHKYQRVASSRYVPRDGCETPFAEWRRIDVVQDALPPRDVGKTEGRVGRSRWTSTSPSGRPVGPDAGYSRALMILAGRNGLTSTGHSGLTVGRGRQAGKGPAPFGCAR